MRRGPASLCAALLASTHAVARAQVAAGATLGLAWCNAADVQQQFKVNAGTVSSPDGLLCATMSYPYPAPLTMQPCVAGAAIQARLESAACRRTPASDG